jgi:hypothetical protein
MPTNGSRPEIMQLLAIEPRCGPASGVGISHKLMKFIDNSPISIIVHNGTGFA